MHLIGRLCAAGVSLLFTLNLSNAPASMAQIEPMNHSDHLDQVPRVAAPPTEGQVLLEKVKAITGTWYAPSREGVMTDIFKPFGFDTAVLAEEWINGKQITSTIFYVVGSELRADQAPRKPAVREWYKATVESGGTRTTNLAIPGLKFAARCARVELHA